MSQHPYKPDLDTMEFRQHSLNLDSVDDGEDRLNEQETIEINRDKDKGPYKRSFFKSSKVEMKPNSLASDTTVINHLTESTADNLVKKIADDLAKES